MPDTDTLPGLGLSGRFAKKHQRRLETFDPNRSGAATAATDIGFSDEIFSVDMPISDEDQSNGGVINAYASISLLHRLLRRRLGSQETLLSESA